MIIRKELLIAITALVSSGQNKTILSAHAQVQTTGLLAKAVSGALSDSAVRSVLSQNSGARTLIQKVAGISKFTNTEQSTRVLLNSLNAILAKTSSLDDMEKSDARDLATIILSVQSELEASSNKSDYVMTLASQNLMSLSNPTLFIKQKHNLTTIKKAKIETEIGIVGFPSPVPHEMGASFDPKILTYFTDQPSKASSLWRFLLRTKELKNYARLTRADQRVMLILSGIQLTTKKLMSVTIRPFMGDGGINDLADLVIEGVPFAIALEDLPPTLLEHRDVILPFPLVFSNADGSTLDSINFSRAHYDKRLDKTIGSQSELDEAQKFFHVLDNLGSLVGTYHDLDNIDVSDIYLSIFGDICMTVTAYYGYATSMAGSLIRAPEPLVNHQCYQFGPDGENSFGTDSRRPTKFDTIVDIANQILNID